MVLLVRIALLTQGLNFIDKAFVASHCLQLVLLKPGDKCVYLTAGKTKIRVIGTTSL